MQWQEDDYSKADRQHMYKAGGAEVHLNATRAKGAGSKLEVGLG